MFMMLAHSLIQEGDKAKALKVLEKCKTVLPEYTVPYDDDDSQLASLWLAAGNKKEAARVAKSVLDYNIAYLNYINSLGTERVNTYTKTCYYLASSTLEAVQALGQADPKAYNAMQPKLNNLSKTNEAYMQGMQIYFQQMSGHQ